MLVWPPVDTTDYAGWPALLASLSWFFGHLAEEIVIPVAASALSGHSMPVYAAAGALKDAARVRVVNLEAGDASAQKYFDEADFILSRKRDLAKTPPPIALRRMRGSEAVVGLTETKDASAPCYYFIGTPDNDKQDAYYAVCFTYWLEGGEDKDFLERSRKQLMALKPSASTASKVAVFGTGPSLAESLNRDYSTSFNIICNTIVKNRSFLDRLQPRIIVASDAHFHFSFHRYSARFLSDLLHLLDTYGTSFFTFDKFAAFIKRRVPELAGQVFGIPAGRSIYGFDLDREYKVFPGESVLNMFLLPIASFLSDTVSLNGFTGRSATDSYFWSHSDLHQYSDRMEDVRLAHPAFFANRDYNGYAEAVDKQIADRVIIAGSAGKHIYSETTSFYSSFVS